MRQSSDELTNKTEGEKSSKIREQVMKTREVQESRFAEDKAPDNYRVHANNHNFRLPVLPIVDSNLIDTQNSSNLRLV